MVFRLKAFTNESPLNEFMCKGPDPPGLIITRLAKVRSVAQKFRQGRYLDLIAHVKVSHAHVVILGQFFAK